MTVPKHFTFLAFLLSISVSFLPLHSVLAAAYITLDAFSGPATTVGINGGGWTPGETVSIYLSNTSGTPVHTVEAGPDSFFESVQVDIPDNTPQGALPIIAVGSISTAPQENSYYVIPFTPTIVVSGNNTPGGALQISGQGFAPNENVVFSINNVQIGQASSDEEGSFLDGSAVVPNLPPASYELHATGQSSGADTIDYFYLGGFYPSVSPSSYYLLPKDVLNFSGSGFATNETINIFQGNQPTPLGTISADSDGQFENAGSILIPLGFAGEQTFRLYGTTSNGEASVSITVGMFNPLANPSAHYLLPDETLNFSGGGFAPSEQVSVYSNGTKLSEFAADENGNFLESGNITIPYAWLNSSRTFVLTGEESAASTDVTITIGQFNSLVEPSTYHLTAGHDVSFTGTGFAANETVNINEGESSVILATLITEPDGTFTNSGNITIPFSWAGSSRTFYLEGQNSHTEAMVILTVADFLPQVSPSSYYLLPGTKISFSGTGFGKLENIVVSDMMENIPLSSILADADGQFSEVGQFIIPFNWSGKHTLQLKGENSQALAVVDISIASFQPQLSPSAYYILPGQPFTISGEGFAPDETVVVKMNNLTEIETMTTSTGSFTEAGPFSAPLKGTTLNILASGQKSGVQAELDISLGSLYPAVTPSSWYVPSGSDILFSGSGFAPGEDVLMKKNNVEMKTIATNLSGEFTNEPVTTEFGPDRTETYTFQGLESDSLSEVSITLAALQPYISLDLYYAPPGTTIHASGVGFAPNEAVTVKIGSETSTGTADSEGTVSEVPITIPLGLSETTVEVSITGNTSQAIGTTAFTQAPFTPQVTPSTWYTPPGTMVTFVGTGFSGLEDVSITINDTNVGSATTDATGDFESDSIIIPITTSGGAHIVFVGEKSGAMTSIDITLAGFIPEVTPSTWYTPAGSKLSFSGSGFAADETINMSFNNTPVTSLMSDSSGSFTSELITIPFGATSASFTFNSTLSNAEISIPITLAPLNPGIQLSNYYGYGGTPLTVSGMGFGGNENINVMFDNVSLGTTTSDVDGNFTLDAIVPGFPAGERQTTATGELSGGTSSATFTHGETYLQAELGSYAGAPGTNISFIGSGYLPNEPINIKTDRTGEEIVHTFSANTFGSFGNSAYAIPADFTEGNLTLKIIGEYSAVPVEIVFYVMGE